MPIVFTMREKHHAQVSEIGPGAASEAELNPLGAR